MLKRVLLALLVALPINAYTSDDIPPELQGLDSYDAFLPVTDENNSNKSTPTRQRDIIPFIVNSIPPIASQNITTPEQVFCYVVTKRTEDYTGYTLNNYAITDYCGELNASQITTSYEALFTQGPNIITTPSNCRIEPRIMLRFVRGVDITDVLLSSPCPSFTVFYASKYKSFNIKQGIINDLITQFEKNKIPFNSPSLLKQTIGNGSPKNNTEEELLEKKKREATPIISWQKKSQPTSEENSSSSAINKPKNSGWGNLKLKIKK